MARSRRCHQQISVVRKRKNGESRGKGKALKGKEGAAEGEMEKAEVDMLVSADPPTLSPLGSPLQLHHIQPHHHLEQVLLSACLRSPLAQRWGRIYANQICSPGSDTFFFISLGMDN